MHFIDQVPLAVIPPGIYMFKFNKETSRRMCEVCSKLRINTSEPEACLEPSRTSTIKLFEKIFSSFKLLNLLAKSSSLDVRLGSDYASENHEWSEMGYVNKYNLSIQLISQCKKIKWWLAWQMHYSLRVDTIKILIKTTSRFTDQGKKMQRVRITNARETTNERNQTCQLSRFPRDTPALEA